MRYLEKKYCSYQFDPFSPKCVPSSGTFAQQKMPRAGPINDDVPGAGHLHQLAFKHENC